jgi:succinyl-CoA synthetase beta subunit
MNNTTYTIDDIEQIASSTQLSKREKVDELLRIDCKQYTELGTDSTKAEREQVKKLSRKIYRLIKTHVDYDMGNRFLQNAD